MPEEGVGEHEAVARMSAAISGAVLVECTPVRELSLFSRVSLLGSTPLERSRISLRSSGLQGQDARLVVSSRGRSNRMILHAFLTTIPHRGKQMRVR